MLICRCSILYLFIFFSRAGNAYHDEQISQTLHFRASVLPHLFLHRASLERSASLNVVGVHVSSLERIFSWKS